MPAVISISWTASSLRLWTDIGTASVSNVVTATYLWLSAASVAGRASTAKMTSSSKLAAELLWSMGKSEGGGGVAGRNEAESELRDN